MRLDQFSPFHSKFFSMPDCLSFGYLLYITHGMDYSSVCLSERLITCILILEEHYESDERLLEENVWTWVVCKSKKRCLLIAYCLRLFVLWYPCSKKENMALQCPESYGIRPINDRHACLCILQVSNVHL